MLPLSGSRYRFRRPLDAVNASSDEARIGYVTDLERLGLGLIGFAVAVVVAGVLLGLIAAWISKKGSGRG